MSVFYKLFQETEAEAMLHSVRPASLSPNTDKDITNISHEHRIKNPPQNLSKFNTTKYKRIIHHSQVGFILDAGGWFNIRNPLK